MFKSAGYYDGSFDQEKFDNSMLASAKQDGLMSKEDKVKLDGLNGASGEEISVKASNVTQDESHRFVSDEQITRWESKPETKEDLELGNVTNDEQVKRSEMGIAGGVATLDESGIIPSSQLPGFVDDVLEYDSVESFPNPGESGKLYVDTNENKSYRWSGTQYVLIGSGDLALGETSATAYAGDKGKANAEAIDNIINGTTVVPKAADSLTVNGFSVKITVPEDAKFTDTIYEHPSTHSASIIVQDETHRFVSDDQITDWDAKAEYAPNTPYYDEAEKSVYACGVGVIVDKSSTEGKLTIKWGDVGGYKTMEVPEGVDIYGGAHGLDTALFYPSTCVTVNGGTVGSVFGGNNERGAVGTSTVIINNAKFIDGRGVFGGGRAYNNNASKPKETDNIVGHANVIVNNTENTLLILYGGGQSISVTGSTRVTVNGGTIGWVTAGGSNGYTGTSELIINDGNITTVQGCNRGSMSNIKTVINGGTIGSVFGGGETGDSNVTATFAKAEVVINGGTINSIAAGTNGGVEAPEKISGSYVDGIISDESAAVLNLVKAPISFNDIIIDGTNLVFKNGDKIIKSIDLSSLKA